MPKLNIVIIHGIGINSNGYADPFIKGVRAQFNEMLCKQLRTARDFSDQLDFIPVVWDDIVAQKEASLENIFKKQLEHRRHKTLLHMIIVAVSLALLYFIFNKSFFFALSLVPLCYFTPKLVFMLRTSFAANFAGDITSYNEKAAKTLILQRVHENLRVLLMADDPNVSIVAHSLGTVIASDSIWEESKPGGLFDKKLLFSNFFSMGSPLALFSLQFGGPALFTKPITVQDPQGVWINIYDADDPIASPLKVLNHEYACAVTEDREINVGPFGIAHVQYWTDHRVHQTIAYKLGRDWLRLNNL